MESATRAGDPTARQHRSLHAVAALAVAGLLGFIGVHWLGAIGGGTWIFGQCLADGSELDPAWLKGMNTVGITAGASAPEVLVDDVIEALRRLGPAEVSILPGRQEKIEFRLPPELAKAS